MAQSKKSKADKNEPKSNRRSITENRKARFKYEVFEQIECGVVLVGSEVKSLRENRISLDEAYVRVKGSELWLVGADIAEYQQATIWNHDRRRSRKLLVQRGQLRKLAVRTQERGYTLVPLGMYFNDRGIVKVLVGVARGKKVHDKRETLKTHDAKRSIDRAMKKNTRK